MYKYVLLKTWNTFRETSGIPVCFKLIIKVIYQFGFDIQCLLNLENYCKIIL